MDIVERPGMPVGYGISAEAAGHVSWAWVAEQLSASRSYWVCTTRDDGRPHAMPVWGVWQADRLMFSTDPTSLKARNFAARPDVVVHLESGDEVVVVEGRVAPMDVELIAAFCEACEVKYSNRPDPDNEAHGLYQLDPDRVLAWRETDFTTSATRFRRTLSS
jgi:Pyridoxamine 5'-phosphate oxidase